MRKTLLMSAAVLAMSAASAFAQGAAVGTQSPPAPAASSQSVQPSNSLPPGAATMSPGTRGIRPGAAMPMTGATMPGSTMPGSTMPASTMPGAAMPGAGSAMGSATAGGAEPSPMPPRHARRAMRRHGMAHGMARRQPVADPDNPGGRAPADQYEGVPPTSAYQGGTGSPYSIRASNIDQANTRSGIAPRLPNPDASGNSPEAFLAAAQRALSRNQTGAAQEALERAQTRVLTRSTDPAAANTPDGSPLSQAIADARRALANGDSGRAQSIIGQYLNRGG